MSLLLRDARVAQAQPRIHDPIGRKPKEGRKEDEFWKKEEEFWPDVPTSYE
jgi:hypothetical protein